MTLDDIVVRRYFPRSRKFSKIYEINILSFRNTFIPTFFLGSSDDLYRLMALAYAAALSPTLTEKLEQVGHVSHIHASDFTYVYVIEVQKND